ncbi:PH domain-containing protein [Patescibacteria group bacterium]
MKKQKKQPTPGSEHKPLTFPTQRPNEHVILLLRRHWTILARDVVQLAASLLLPPVIIVILFLLTDIRLEPGTALYVVVVEALSLYYLFSFLAYFHDFVDYHLDIWVVTDQRIVSIEQVGLFNRVISELNMLRVQDVTSEIKGKVQTFLDYGQVHIQTAGEEARFVFEQVPHPSEVAKVILQVHDRTVKKHQLEEVRQQEDYRKQLGGQAAGAAPGQPGALATAGQPSLAAQFGAPVDPGRPQGMTLDHADIDMGAPQQPGPVQQASPQQVSPQPAAPPPVGPQQKQVRSVEPPHPGPLPEDLPPTSPPGAIPPGSPPTT